MQLRVFLSDTFDPWFNLATEDWIFEDLQDTHSLFLWRNQKTVVIGRSQNPWVECNLVKMEADGVKLARRQTGGGAVFQDLGNTNFTFLSPKTHYDKNANLNIVADALKNLGIEAFASGRNDMLVNTTDGERKISGSAFREKHDRAFHHGTLLVNVDLNDLSQYLNPHPKKLAAKGVQSVRSRVSNLTELNPKINHESLCETMIEAFFAHYQQRCPIEVLDHQVLNSLAALQSRYAQLSDWNWRFGKTLPFTHELDERLSFGHITLRFNCEGGQIAHTQIFSDCLDPDWITDIEGSLRNTPYSAKGIESSLSILTPSNSERQAILSELKEWLTEAMR